MLYCIPTNGDAGLNDTVCAHFGSAPFFTLYDSDDDTVQVLDNRNAHHDHGTCQPLRQLDAYNINGVICGGMGWRAITTLTQQNIRVYRATSGKVTEVVQSIKDNALQEMDPETACQGHGQQHGHGHSHSGGGRSMERGGRGLGAGRQ